ncbi:MAG: cytochrome c3 family protein [Thermodesulfobacteriota bacterium]|nr:cytochrome c3 family protein [Thermodesulfobacteriota bacterium]
MVKSIILTPCLLALLLAIPGHSFAKVTGECANCHTMHNSQNGAVVEADGPYSTLLTNNCVGCHSGSTPTYWLGTSKVPVVNHTGGSAPLEYLAGGNFYWVGTGEPGADAKGHNVLGVANQDLAIDASATEGAPGGVFNACPGCHQSLAVEHTLADFGSGCQGCHLRPAHHADDSAVIVGETGGYYRFLSGHMGGGVIGIEDDDWQLTASASDHNEYLGDTASALNNAGTMATGNNMGSAMSGYCCGCHGNFHNENTEADGSGAWIRHPSDVAIPTTGEYGFYNVYDPNVPVARPDLTGWTDSSGTVTPGTDMVMCLSCHRPHGSPYDDLLRWDYSVMNAGTTGAGAGNGCFVCHTNKDGI